MPEIELSRLVWIVVGVQLHAELGDRPLAYRVEKELRDKLAELLGPPVANEPSRLTPAVISDVYYLNSDEAQSRPVISIGGPGVNALSAGLANELPTVASIEDTLVVQMDLEMKEMRCAVWGMNHLDTVRAVEFFLARGYLDTFARGLIRQVEEEA